MLIPMYTAEKFSHPLGVIWGRNEEGEMGRREGRSYELGKGRREKQTHTDTSERFPTPLGVKSTCNLTVPFYCDRCLLLTFKLDRISSVPSLPNHLHSLLLFDFRTFWQKIHLEYRGRLSCKLFNPDMTAYPYPLGITRGELTVSYSKLAEISRNSCGLYR